jgi:hypothetical protein
MTNIKNVHLGSLSFGRLMIIAYNWRIQKGGLRPITLEDHLRNIHNYCSYAKHLN